jgi:hypothetical protein
MFVGHYSVAFAGRTEQNKIPLWVLFVAVQFLDYIWATLVLLGIEKLRVIKGFTAGSMLHSYFHPYSHSLIAAILWSGVAALSYKLLCRWRGYGYTKSAALVIGVVVFSHWILDLIAHPRDLPIYDNTAKVGFGLWNYRDPEFALEIALLALGIVLYLARNVIPTIRSSSSHYPSKRSALGRKLARRKTKISKNSGSRGAIDPSRTGVAREAGALPRLGCSSAAVF